MRHRKKSEKLSRSRAQRKALANALVRALIIAERIITTKSKAKYCQRAVSRLITWAKSDSLSHRRLCYRWLKDHRLVKRLFESIGPRFKDTNGGYTRLFNLGFRKGDGARIALLELTKIEKKEAAPKKKKKEEEKEETEKVEKKAVPLRKEEKPKRGFVSGVKKIFKKERDGL